MPGVGGEKKQLVRDESYIRPYEKRTSNLSSIYRGFDYIQHI